MRYIRRRAETGPVWSYFFNQDFTIEGGRAPWHCSDIPFVFHNTELVPSANISGVTPQLEQQIFDAVEALKKEKAGSAIEDFKLFDLYRPKDETDVKSMAFHLTMVSRGDEALTEEAAEHTQKKLLLALGALGITLRA